MSDLNKIDKNSAAAWWNDDRTKKWDNENYQKESPYYYVFNQRLNNLVELIKKSKIKNPKILELGFGGGQLAEVLLSKNLCFSYTGLDVSKHLCDSTEKKLSQYKIDKEIKIFHRSIDDKLPFENSNFDIVLACGVFQYSLDFNKSLKEINRVLKNSGFFIFSQANINCFSIDIFNLKRLILRVIYNFSKQEYQIDPCFKSILTESFFKKYFNKYKNTKFFNSKFMLSGSYFKDYNYKKRIFSFKTMKTFLESNQFKIDTATGAGFFFAEKGFLRKIKIILNEFLQNICNKYNYLKLYKFSHHIQYFVKKK